MFDQLIWYFCLAFSSACACAGQRLPHTGGPARPWPAPAPRPSRSQAWLQREQQLSPLAALHLRLVQVATSSQSQAKHQHTLSPAVLRAEKKLKRISLPCSDSRDLRLCSLLLQLPIPCSHSLSLGLGKEPCTAVTRGSVVAPTLPAPWLLKAKLAAIPIFVPTPVPFLHTAGSFQRGMGHDGMRQPGCQGSALAPLDPGQALGDGE